MNKLTDTQKANLTTIDANVKDLLEHHDNKNTTKLLALEFIKMEKILDSDDSDITMHEAKELSSLTQEENDLLFSAITSIGQSETMDYMNMSLDELEALSRDLLIVLN